MAEKPTRDAKTPAPATAGSSQLETAKAERHVWLMKCPPVVARAMQSTTNQPSPATPDASSGRIVAKVVVAVDPLRPNDDLSSTQVYMCAHLHWKSQMCEYVPTCSPPPSVSRFDFEPIWAAFLECSFAAFHFLSFANCIAEFCEACGFC